MGQVFDRIAEVKPIEGADKIEAYRVDGWWVVSEKGEFNVGDLCCFFEIDSFLPVREEFEFLRKNCFKSTKNLGDGFRLRTIRLKGQISQGLILPLSAFSELNNVNSEKSDNLTYWDAYVEGDDITEILKVQKYEAPIPTNLQGIMRGNFPSFIPKTDQERYQNVSKQDLLDYLSVPFEITTKMNGTSMTAYFKDGYFGVCSRNIDLKDDIDNENGSESIYWKVARKLNLKEILENDVSINLAIQGELCGPGIQGNPQKLKDHELFVFDIFNISELRYLTPFERHILLSRPNFSHLNRVPINFVGTLGARLLDDAYIHDLADSVMYNNEPAEGLVFKANDGKFSFKMVNDKYLLKEKD